MQKLFKLKEYIFYKRCNYGDKSQGYTKKIEG